MIASSVHYLLRRHGVAAKLLRGVAQEYDPATSEVTESYDQYAVRIVFVDNVWQRMRDSLVAGNNLQRIVISGGEIDIEPESRDRIKYRNDYYSISSVRTVTERDTVLAYVCEVSHDA